MSDFITLQVWTLKLLINHPALNWECPLICESASLNGTTEI